MLIYVSENKSLLRKLYSTMLKYVKTTYEFNETSKGPTTVYVHTLNAP